MENYFQNICLRWIVIGQLAEAEPNKLHLLVCNNPMKETFERC